VTARFGYTEPIDVRSGANGRRSSPRSPESPGSAGPVRRTSYGLFVSIFGARDVRLEDISDLVGRSSTPVTETACRHEIRHALTGGTPTVNRILKVNGAKSA
jgi:hypothetical protein